MYFFFSSRRRHTIFDCDWSSDVCSSDLYSSSQPSARALSSSAIETRQTANAMSTLYKRGICATLVIAAASACSSATQGTGSAVATAPVAAQAVINPESEAAAIAQAKRDSLRHPYTEADVHFMSGMIHHHSQAIVMARWAVSHGASPGLQRLADPIINAQHDQ